MQEGREESVKNSLIQRIDFTTVYRYNVNEREVFVYAINSIIKGTQYVLL